jgi:hypothetical protein
VPTQRREAQIAQTAAICGRPLGNIKFLLQIDVHHRSRLLKCVSDRRSAHSRLPRRRWPSSLTACLLRPLAGRQMSDTPLPGDLSMADPCTARTSKRFHLAGADRGVRCRGSCAGRHLGAERSVRLAGLEPSASGPRTISFAARSKPLGRATARIAGGTALGAAGYEWADQNKTLVRVPIERP